MEIPRWLALTAVVIFVAACFVAVPLINKHLQKKHLARLARDVEAKKNVR